jgi:hypothetical protein
VNTDDELQFLECLLMLKIIRVSEEKK